MELDYALENLGPDGFQTMCQALLAALFPGAQCFPIGQSDGGRDALVRLEQQGADTCIVFQVKYASRPLAERKPHAWLKKALAEEAPKVRALIQKGAARYFLLTNIPGTGHPNAGSIDSVQKIFDELLDIPGECWWRNDINRRLDSQWNIKWSYPQILNGTDILRYIIEHGLQEDARRRALAIRAFVTDQYNRDTDVRFKQVELQNKLLDLFIDVPLNVTKAGGKWPETEQVVPLAFVTDASETSIGAVSFLLHPVAHTLCRYVVIEGAPGQGKSTIVQYLCQIHRQRLRGQELDRALVKKEHLDCPVRLPLKVDCRDFSTWLGRKNPFAAEGTADVPVDWHKSLESFLSWQIQNFSGGVAFKVADLQAVLKISAVLLVFDGLDEVADIGRREEVVEQITAGVHRLQEIAASVQVVVTSRPAAFTNSPGMPRDLFHYFSLSSLSPALIEEYAEKWARARKLDARETAEVRRILIEKIREAHIRELATSPMQLAILLRLIQTHSESLPDKRTALYDKYVDLLFNREAEKSAVVREHRDLLIEIHRYLAWRLHASAQLHGIRGSVTSAKLRELLSEYLTHEGRDSRLTDLLFTGMVERVRALVSRVEGTYEFVVQPLREYFAARHLYETAPYSPAGDPQKGTLPERFDALCRDFYWQNVTRFYAGCYSKGELPSLVDRLHELAAAPGYALIKHPRELAAILLADWVFSQDPKSMKQVIALLLGGELTCLAPDAYGSAGSSVVVLPEQCGGMELVNRSFELLGSLPPMDQSVALVDLIMGNGSVDARFDRWLKYVDEASGRAKTRWIHYGLMLDVLKHLTESQVARLLDCAEEESERLSLLGQGNPARIEADRERFRDFIDASLAGNPMNLHDPLGSWSTQLLHVLHPYFYSRAFMGISPAAVKNLWSGSSASNEMESSWQGDLGTDSVGWKCKELVTLGRSLGELSAAQWATSLEPWNLLVEKARELFGDRWAFHGLACLSANVRCTDDCHEASALLAPSAPLCRRIRFASLHAHVDSWWQAQLTGANTQDELALVLLAAFHWVDAMVVQRLARLFDEKLGLLEQRAWLKLTEARLYLDFQNVRDRRDSEEPDMEALGASLPSPRTLVFMGLRGSPANAERIFRRFLAGYDGADRPTLDFCLQHSMGAMQRDSHSWRKWLPIVKRIYAQDIMKPHSIYPLPKAHQDGRIKVPFEMIEKVLRDHRSYPLALVQFAEQAYRQRVASEVTPVGKVASRDRWFTMRA